MKLSLYKQIEWSRPWPLQRGREVTELALDLTLTPWRWGLGFELAFFFLPGFHHEDIHIGLRLGPLEFLAGAFDVDIPDLKEELDEHTFAP